MGRRSLVAGSRGSRVEKLDRRYRPPRRGHAVEVEALGQGVVTGLVRAALDAP